MNITVYIQRIESIEIMKNERKFGIRSIKNYYIIENTLPSNHVYDFKIDGYFYTYIYFKI